MAIDNNPDFAVVIAHIIALSASIDHELGMLLGRILGADASVALAMYATLQTQNLQRAVLRAAAKTALKDDGYQIFQAVIMAAESAQAERHRLAHWIWGYSPELPDSLFLADPEYLKERKSQLGLLYKGKKVDDPNAEKTPIVHVGDTIDYSKIFVYKLGDLQKAKRDLTEVAEILFQYHIYLDPYFTHDEIAQHGLDPYEAFGTRGGALRQLSNLRLFREALEAVKGRAENNTL